METETQITKKAKASLMRQQKLLALNADDQKEFEKMVKKAKKKGPGRPKQKAVMCVRHLANEFQEKELKGYFGQFGKINRLRLARSRKTGNSRGYAFIEFDDQKDAKIAAKTMDKYLMHEKIMRCDIIPKEKVHADIFKGCNQEYFFGALYRKNRRVYNQAKTEKSTKRALAKREDKDAKLRAILKAHGLETGIC